MQAVNNNNIRKLNFKGLEIGGETDFLKTKPVFALELNIFDFNTSSHIVKNWYKKRCKTLNAIDLIKEAQKTDCDILGLKFNIPDEDLENNIKKSQDLLKSLLPNITKPLLIRGINNKNVDKKLLPALMKVLDREAIIAFADENTYKDITPGIIKGNHILVIRTPIDINLAKEMNILANDAGVSLDKILIDTDMGGLGYGLEYGYSIMERIKLAAFEGDKMLNMPLIAFAGEEALKTKETKSDTFSKSFGDFKERSNMFEITTATAVMSAGANLIVLNCPDSIRTIKDNL